MYAADLYFWRRVRVNYPYIFGSKRGTELGCQEVFLLGAGLAVLASASFLASLYLDRDPSTRKYRTEAEKVPLYTTAVRSLKRIELLLTTFYYFHGYNIVSYCTECLFIQHSFYQLFLPSCSLFFSSPFAHSTFYTSQVVFSSSVVFYAVYPLLCAR